MRKRPLGQSRIPVIGGQPLSSTITVYQRKQVLRQLRGLADRVFVLPMDALG